MGKLGCVCGNTISDSEFPSPCAATLISQKEETELEEIFVKNVEEFLLAVRTGMRDSWLQDFFGETYPADLSDGLIISDINTKAKLNVGRAMLTCVKCHRMQLQKAVGSPYYTPYEKQG